jgi:hypothetical protein
MTVTLDPQATGWFDDGSEGGAVRAAITRGDLVMMPFRGGHFAVPNGGVTYYGGGFLDNEDGSGSRAILSVAHGTGGSGANIIQPFYGSVFGLRWLRDSTAPTCFSVIIDGMSYLVAGQDPRWVGDGLTVADTHSLVVIAKDLPEVPGGGPHWADISVTQDSNLDRSLTLFGYLVERRAGYAKPAPRIHLNASGTLTTNPTAICDIGGYGQYGIYSTPAIRGIIYSNISLASATVTIKQGSNALATCTIAAGSTWTFDPLGPFALNATYTHQASAASSLTYMVLGAY